MNGESRANMGLIMAIVAVATIGGLLFGYDSGAVNGTQDGLKTTFALSEGGLGFTVGSLLIGCFIGAFLAGRLADLIGRRNVMILTAVLFLIGALIQGFSHEQWIFVAARIAGGMAVGAASVLSPAYISEVAPANIRGRMTTIQQIMIISGLTAAFVVNYWLAKTAGASTNLFWGGYEAWRWMYWMQAIPATVFLIALFFIPESPRYLVSKGRNAEATRVLTSLFGAGTATNKLIEIQASFSDHRPTLRDILDPVKGGVRPIVWAGLLLAVFQQLVGINVIFYYGATLWQLAGFTENDALLINIVSGLVSIAACFVTVALVDRIGRKPLLLIGSAGMAVALFAMVFAFSRGSLDAQGKLVLSQQLGIIAVIAANLYVVFFNVSWGPVMWVMLGEMFPNQIRGSALAVCGFAQWFSNYLIAQSFPIMAAGLGLAVSYSFYAVCAVISFFLVSKFIHETKGVELEDMQG
ncbi:MFS transporter [Sphingomonas koreensis]|jgi:SP family sugar:H+ symporter-like MFS transporter|uniref:MFS transporter n=1 Tax=Sphingomonas koreensis TaxID=93064 RepID=A0A1L6J638_9SPHN|nr:sugar porter family MFS transporter [Sphingomonas koreensis]APR51403.1 MFS transporter [Sphingomonas koreensis]MDC7810974.1 sugar porter family MFS transporter [Sphingomonas koreensis]RSU22707.1 MFS transporter [Sphingomonas koreensis]RSU27737.1 MFS transporter [Sphingomonas koreensis]RSU29247.1 MFS transporter [Sphingomonas koreensis]